MLMLEAQTAQTFFFARWKVVELGWSSGSGHVIARTCSYESTTLNPNCNRTPNKAVLLSWTPQETTAIAPQELLARIHPGLLYHS